MFVKNFSVSHRGVVARDVFAVFHAALKKKSLNDLAIVQAIAPDALAATIMKMPRKRAVMQAATPVRLGALIALCLAQSAFAQSADAPTGLWSRSTLFGDLGGLRPWLDARGVTFGLQETSEYLNNLSGGTHRSGAYDGFTELSVGVDTQKAFGWPGGVFNVSALQIHGTSLTQRNLQALQAVSGVEADAGTRLWELWYQQSFASGKADIKIGQQSADQEFMASEYAGAFMNATFGWPVLPSVDMPAGGPAYPLSSLGVRLRVTPSNAWTVLAGVFDGNPSGIGSGSANSNGDAHGTNFNLHDGALFIGEVQYALNASDTSAPDAKSSGLPGTYKLGFWYNTQHFADQQFDTGGVSLANPASTGMAQSHRGDYGLYAVADQMVWRPSADSPQSLGVFARVMGAPGDRNLVDLAVNAGVTLKAPFTGRDNDVAGLAVSYAKIGSHARGLANDTAAVTPGYPALSSETVLEATYQFQIAPWWQVQADFQYVFRPGGGVPDPQNTSRRIGDEAVVGVRTVVAF
ncbi:OprB family porin [Paraburkholderia tropica]|uniref:OprB family porin n=2 Tax=Paraburkholderia tropica TaxID=92647 RepID=A0AAQ1JTA4_9BURK|nr:OprB family porin [Paraburkholderia tropica]PZW87136.1 OprB family porin [Paraburkholderia tropica]SEJ40070.1 porin, OprB family [Paraburkholderia tropica]